MSEHRNNDLEILLRISKQNENLECFAGQREYLDWFLGESSGLIPEAAGLVLANLQYISPMNPPRYSGGSIYGIPSVVDLTVLDRTEIIDYLAGTMAFLRAVQMLEAPNPNVVHEAVEKFKRKFILQISSLSSEELSEPAFVHHRQGRMLSIKLPIPAMPERLAAHFKPRVAAGQGFLGKELPNKRILIDGLKFEKSYEEESSPNEIEQFQSEINNFLHHFARHGSVIPFARKMHESLKKAGFEIDLQICEGFLFTGALHSWLKAPTNTYMIPLTFTMFPGGPPALGIFLINCQGELEIEELSKLHLALGLALKGLTDIEVRHMPELHPPAPPKASQAVIPVLTVKKPADSWRDSQFCGMVGASEEMRSVFRKVETVSRHDHTDVLIIGESGSGKEGIANAIHTLSGRKNGPFVAVSLADRPDTLVESELFGHEKGAFTGALKQYKGFFEYAHTGTLFLDEICHISPNVQTKLLRVLQNRKIQRLGGGIEIPVDVRVISATSKNLANEALREQLNFIDPLYYRLQEYVIVVPPLRERKSDIPLLVDYFLSMFNYSQEHPVVLAPEALVVLMDYHWPGNVRQLMNITKRAFINAYDERVIRQDHFELETLEDGKYRFSGLEKRLQEVMDGLRANNFIVEQTRQYLAARNAFHPNRKTLIRHCRELCLWHLARSEWDLSEAVRALAGCSTLEPAAAHKFRDYIFGDKSSNGLMGHLERGDYRECGLVRQAYQPLLEDFALLVKSGKIGPDKWQEILRQYSNHR